MSSVPKRGAVININFNIQRGPIEIRKVRPALVLSPSSFNERQNTVVVCPITSKKRDSEFHVEIESDDVERVERHEIKTVEGSSIVTNLFTTMKWEPTSVLCYLGNDIVCYVCDIIQSILDATETTPEPGFIPLKRMVVDIKGTPLDQRQLALVLSTSKLNYWQRLFTICPISDRPDSEFAVKIPDTDEFILADQVKSWDWWYRDAYEKHGELPEPTFKDVCKIVQSIIWGAPS